MKKMADMSTPINEMGLYKAYLRLRNCKNRERSEYFITDEEKQKIVELYHQGVSKADIAKRIDRSLGSVQMVLCRENTQTRPRNVGRIDIDSDIVMELRQKGLTLVEISKQLGCSYSLVVCRLNRYKNTNRGVYTIKK